MAAVARAGLACGLGCFLAAATAAGQRHAGAPARHALRLPAHPGGAGQGPKAAPSNPARPLPESVSEAIAAAVAEAGELRFAAGYGYADVENEVEATPETVYRYASVSKPITATAALLLSERGRLDLDAPVWRYCAAYPVKPWPVSSRQLLCHQGGVRRLVQRLHTELSLPVYVLVDNDPWGFYIYSVMKQGSINLAYESMRMAVPDARFIGLSSFDKETYGIPANVAIKMDDGDNSRARQMLAYPWFKAARWQREIQEMVRSGQKFELEALSRRGISFITEEYLPRKLRDKDWLE